MQVCQKARPQQICPVPSDDIFDSLRRNACHIEFQENNCAALLAENPSLNGKIKNCDQPSHCSMPLSVREFGRVCFDSFKNSWTDMAKGLAGFLFGSQSLSDTIKQREEFLQTCTTVACKYEMLGPFASLFTKAEIEGAEDKSKLDSQDLAQQNAHSGLSAATLYRKLLLKLKDQTDRGLVTEDFIEPWSGTAAKLPKNFNELIDNALSKMGLSNTACFDPAVLAEMRCYAFFTVLDPTLLIGGGMKIASMTGRASGLEKLLAKQIVDMRPPSVPITVYNEVLEAKMKRVKTIADRKKFDQDPYVQTVSNKIGAGRSDIRYFDKNVALNAKTATDGDKFVVTVQSVKANPGLGDLLGVTVAGREAGANSTMAKTFYSTLRGASLAAKANPAIRVVRIDAGDVVNIDLKRNLTEMGFVSVKTHLPLTEKQIANRAGQSLVFELPVEKLAELGY